MEMPAEGRNTFKEALASPGAFCVTWEQVPGRGAFEKQHDIILEAAEQARKGGRVHAISITDNPGGGPALSSVALGVDIKRLGIEPLVHLALRDRNRNQIESALHGLAAAGVSNVLVMSGDYPTHDSFEGQAQPVFDLDPTHVMQLVTEMNHGLKHEILGHPVKLAPNHFFAGVVANPFKTLEPEVMCQYYKLGKKVLGGAQFIVSQVGYDARKMHELILWLREHGRDVPVMANLYVLGYHAAKMMHANRIPGCVVTDKLLQQLDEERQTPDKGRAAKLQRAAEQYAVAKGLGYKGVHLGGYSLHYEDVEHILDAGEALAPRWESLLGRFEYPQANAFYYFTRCGTGLNTTEPAPRPAKGAKPLNFRLGRIFHFLTFETRSPFFGIWRRFADWVERHPTFKAVAEFAEHGNKNALFSCLRCGDCALTDTAYICPVSQCPKGERVGPCGGSFEGWCEVYPGERLCVWVRAYERLKASHEEETLGSYIIPPRNWQLWQTSAWLNYFSGKDHTARRLGIKPFKPAASDHA
jgi:methylenetetrahydrofolate reductase (NADPH)